MKSLLLFFIVALSDTQGVCSHTQMQKEEIEDCIHGIFKGFQGYQFSPYNNQVLRVEKGSEGRVLYNNHGDKTFEVMSVTKAFAGTVINQLINEGKIWYKDSFTEYLPPDIDWTKWCAKGQVRSITVRDLLSHTSGFQDLWDKGTDFLADWKREGDFKAWSPREVLSYMPSFEHVCSSGSAFSYADTNWLVLGIIIEHITGGNTLAHEIRTRILEKVGMSNTFMLHYERPDGTPKQPSCQVRLPGWLGDGWCDANGGYNTPECAFDRLDCCEYSCTAVHCGRGSRDACVVDKPFWNEGEITTGFPSFSADWGGSGYVSTAEDLAKFIKAWYKNPEVLFCPATSRCRVTSDEMKTRLGDGDYYSMGFEMFSFGKDSFGKDHFGYGHSGINNSFMFYVGPYGAIITGTLNLYEKGESDPPPWYHLAKQVMTCLDSSEHDDDWLHDCPGNDSETYVEVIPQCKRSCNVWQWADPSWSWQECFNKCKQDAPYSRWDDQYVTCLERNKECHSSKSNINSNKCEWESGCPAECRNAQQNWWDCIPQCEAP